MKTPKIHRTERDLDRMKQFFYEYQFLRYQEPAYRYYPDLLNLCNLRAFPDPGTDLTQEDEQFLQTETGDSPRSLRKLRNSIMRLNN